MTLWIHSNTQWTGLDARPARTVITFYKSGTSEKATVFKDPDYNAPHAYEIITDALGRAPAIYLKPGSGKLRADYQTGSYRVRSIDGIDTGDVTVADANTLKLPASAVTTTTPTLTADDFGTFQVINAASGAVVPVILPDPINITNGLLVGIENSGAGLLSIRSAGVGLIDGIKAVIVPARTSLLVRANGGGYKTFAISKPKPTQWAVKSRTISTPPVTAVAGDTYIAPSTATGLWAPTKVYEANGAGGWIATQPVAGDEAAVLDETVTVGAGVSLTTSPAHVTFSGAEWISDHARTVTYVTDYVAAQLAPVAARVTVLEAGSGAKRDRFFLARCRAPNGTSSLAAQGGVQPTAGTWTTNKLTEMSQDGLTTVTLTSDTITLPAGSYVVRARRVVKGQINAAVGFRNTSGTIFIRGMPRVIEVNDNELVEVVENINVTVASDTFQMVFLLSGTVGPLSLGDAAALPGEAEMFAEVIIETLTPL